MSIIPADIQTIGILAGLFFIFIALVGGGFSIKEIQIPKMPKWMRALSFFVGIGLMAFFIYIPSPTPPPPPDGTQVEQIIYSDTEHDTTTHNITFLQLVAGSKNNPPRVNDRITIEFTLQNVGNSPIKFLETFVAARNPLRENKDFGYSNQGETIQQSGTIKTKANIIVDMKGIWEFGPCYALDIPTVTEEDNLCPSEWRRFKVLVQ